MSQRESQRTKTAIQRAPFFSICIPAYNAEEHLPNLLRSISCQSFQSFEVLIVDDGSRIPLKVGLLDIPTNIQDSVNIIRIENSGPYIARQIAVQHAIGQVILFFDADDRIIGDSALKQIYRGFDAGDVDIVLFNYSRDYAHPALEVNYSAFQKGGEFDFDAYRSSFICSPCYNSLWNKAFSSKLIKGLPVDNQRLVIAEDRLQCFRLLNRATNAVLVDMPLYCYSTNMNSTMNSGMKADYYHQCCIVEEQILTISDLDSQLRVKWGDYFAKQTCSCLLAIACNPSFSIADRLGIYSSMRRENACVQMLELVQLNRLSRLKRLQLMLFKSGRFRELDSFMLPRKIASRVKHTFT